MIRKNEMVVEDNFVIDKINRRRKKVDRLRLQIEVFKKDIMRLKRESYQYAKANGKIELFFEAFPEEKEKLEQMKKEQR